jgi:hypothetical protein
VSGSALSPERFAQLVQLTTNGDAESGLGVDFGPESAAASVVRLKNGKGIALLSGGGPLRLWGLVAGDVVDSDFGTGGARRLRRLDAALARGRLKQRISSWRLRRRGGVARV